MPSNSLLQPSADRVPLSASSERSHETARKSRPAPIFCFPFDLSMFGLFAPHGRRLSLIGQATGASVGQMSRLSGASRLSRRCVRCPGHTSHLQAGPPESRKGSRPSRPRWEPSAECRRCSACLICINQLKPSPEAVALLVQMVAMGRVRPTRL